MVANESCPVCYGGELERGPAGLAWCCDSCTYMRLIHDDTEEED